MIIGPNGGFIVNDNGTLASGLACCCGEECCCVLVNGGQPCAFHPGDTIDIFVDRWDCSHRSDDASCSGTVFSHERIEVTGTLVFDGCTLNNNSSQARFTGFVQRTIGVKRVSETNSTFDLGCPPPPLTNTAYWTTATTGEPTEVFNLTVTNPVANAEFNGEGLNGNPAADSWTLNAPSAAGNDNFGDCNTTTITKFADATATFNFDGTCQLTPPPAPNNDNSVFIEVTFTVNKDPASANCNCPANAICFDLTPLCAGTPIKTTLVNGINPNQQGDPLLRDDLVRIGNLCYDVTATTDCAGAVADTAAVHQPIANTDDGCCCDVLDCQFSPTATITVRVVEWTCIYNSLADCLANGTPATHTATEWSGSSVAGVGLATGACPDLNTPANITNYTGAACADCSLPDFNDPCWSGFPGGLGNLNIEKNAQGWVINAPGRVFQTDITSCAGGDETESVALCDPIAGGQFQRVQRFTEVSITGNEGCECL